MRRSSELFKPLGVFTRHQFSADCTISMSGLVETTLEGPQSGTSILTITAGNQRISTVSALQTFVTCFFTDCPGPSACGFCISRHNSPDLFAEGRNENTNDSYLLQ